MRPAILFAALVVMATGTFSDANAWIEPLPAIRKLPLAARIALMYVPWVILVGVLWLYGRVGPRVRGHIAWFIVLALLAVAQIYTAYAAPLLMLVVALVLIQCEPRPGILYDAALFPAVRAFVGLTLLASVSLGWGADIFGFDLLAEEVPAIPREGLAFAVCAVAVAAFISIARLRHRRVQPCGAAPLLTAGSLVLLAGLVASHLPSKVSFALYASSALLITGHVLLFAAAFLLLSHLLPRREADDKH